MTHCGIFADVIDRSRTIEGAEVPTFFYGTAWKEERTEPLVTQALAAGFRAIDTANQRKHYFEEGVGRAIAHAFESGLSRGELFLQTKFTFLGGQDHRLPYDPKAPAGEQVAQSFASSLAHLGVDVIDSYVLHGPSQRNGLGSVDVEVWRAMEALHDAEKARLLGVSNVAPDQLEALLRVARVRPAFVQNRCYASQRWDAAVRAVCARHAITYQGFSLLTANDKVIHDSRIPAIARRHGCTPAQIVFAFALQLGMIPLTGTSDPRHMAEDLAAHDIELTPEEIVTIERI